MGRVEERTPTFPRARAAGSAPEPQNRLDRAFRRGRPALVCYLTVGDPDAPADLHELYAEHGVDVLEVGVPAGVPFSDGPVIAASHERAVARGMTLDRASETIASWRRALPEQALVWMTYPDAANGPLVDRAAASGVDGVVIPGPA